MCGHLTIPSYPSPGPRLSCTPAPVPPPSSHRPSLDAPNPPSLLTTLGPKLDKLEGQHLNILTQLASKIEMQHHLVHVLYSYNPPLSHLFRLRPFGMDASTVPRISRRDHSDPAHIYRWSIPVDIRIITFFFSRLPHDLAEQVIGQKPSPSLPSSL